MSIRVPRALTVGAGAVVVLAVVAQLTAADGGAPAPEVVPVVSTELVCPDARTVPDDLATTGVVTTQLSAVTPSNLEVGKDGRAVIGSTTAPAAYGTINAGTHALVRTTPAGTTAVVGSAIGGRAPGFAMDQLTTSTKPGDYGLAGVTCTEPGNDAWFVGTGSAVGHASRLFLTDTEATPATVDIELYGKNGRIDAPNALGLVVGANSRRVVRLDLLAPGAGPLAVRVSAITGRVAAAVLDTEVEGLVPQGADWLPVAEAPQTRVVVPGLAGGAGARKLSVFAPGEGSATVRVRLVGAQGSFAPTGAASFDIDRGRLTTVDLGNAIVADQAAAVLESEVPMVAGVRWSLTAGSVDELAFSAGAPALTAPAVVAGNRVDNGWRTGLMLTAPETAGEVSVQVLLNGVPRGAPVVIKVGADRTVRRSMPNAAITGSFQVVITPTNGSGPVHAAVVRERAVGGAAGTTIAVVREARIAVGVPAAWPNLDVGLGR